MNTEFIEGNIDILKVLKLCVCVTLLVVSESSFRDFYQKIVIYMK